MMAPRGPSAWGALFPSRVPPFYSTTADRVSVRGEGTQIDQAQPDAISAPIRRSPMPRGYRAFARRPTRLRLESHSRSRVRHLRYLLRTSFCRTSIQARAASPKFPGNACHRAAPQVCKLNGRIQSAFTGDSARLLRCRALPRLAGAPADSAGRGNRSRFPNTSKF